MNIFDVLDPKLSLDQKYFIEASAGCGKTFSIENAYVRLIMESESSQEVENILVLTFTKEATSQLRSRIYQSLKNALHELQQNESALGYIQRIQKFEEGEKAKVFKKLKTAIANFDQAQIFTIHKFCFLQLKKYLFDAHLNLSQDPEQAQISLKTYEKIVLDYLNFGWDKSILSIGQMNLLLSYFKKDTKVLVRSIVSQISKEMPVEATADFSSFYRNLESKIKSFSTSSKEALEAFLYAAPLFNKATDRAKNIKPALLEAIQSFCEIFSSSNLKNVDAAIEVFPKIGPIFQLENLKKTAAKNAKGPLWDLFIVCQKTFFADFERVSSADQLIALICSQCYHWLDIYFQKRGALTPNNILQKLHKLIENKEVKYKIAQQYSALIVDEFQDTDPIQWDILSNLFLKDGAKRPIYLVGDPKQSIYGFRKADIYTYLRAAKMMGVEPHTLNTNYRSQVGLIDALNTLFQEKNNRWITLPKEDSYLEYQPVKSSSKVEKKDFKDDKGSVHFMFGNQSERSLKVPSISMERDYLFPFILNEILHFQKNHVVDLGQCAILVKDRFQSDRLKAFLKAHQVPFTSSRVQDIQGLKTIKYFLQIFQAILSPKKRALIANLELNPLLDWPHSLFSEENLQKVIVYFSELRSLLFQEGFLVFYQKLVQDHTLLDQSIYENLLAQNEGIYLYHEMEQVKEILVQKEMNGQTPYELLKTLEELSSTDTVVDQSFPLRQNFSEEGVQILTLHMSKGLEFDVVFALGLASQVSIKENLISFDLSTLFPESSISKKDLLLYQEEVKAESLRTLYVAMTRAKQRLYLPYISSSTRSHNSKPSAMELFISQLDLDESSLQDFISNQQEFSYTVLEKLTALDKPLSIDQPELTAPNIVELSFPSKYRHSFTSLAKAHTSKVETLAPHDFEVLSKSIHNLPAGADTGTLVHQILENISFQKDVSLEPYLIHTPFEGWKDILNEWMSKLINTPLRFKNAFSLRDIDEKNIFKEVEFLYPFQGKNLFPELILKDGYLQGYIDLICCYEGKYYLIDYKTNWLGPDCRSYDDLESVMIQNDYLTQAVIYKEALKKYLTSFEDRPFDDCFGGIIYWFLRGLEHSHQGQYLVN